jgi:LacI family transcriptional regulator
VSLIGFDDFNLATFTDPQITVISQPVSEIGRAAGAAFAGKNCRKKEAFSENKL